MPAQKPSIKQEINKLTKNYYSPHTKIYLEKLWWEKHPQSLSSSEKQYLKQLKTRFKRLIILRNKLAKEKKFSNYFNLFIHQSGIPQHKLQYFFKYAQKISRQITLNLSSYISKQEYFDGTMYGFDLSHLASNTKYNLPKDIQNFILKQNQNNSKYLNKIKLIHSSSKTYSSRYNYTNKTATIKFDKHDTSLTGALLLTHEYGHTLNMLKAVEKHNEHTYPKPYTDEKRAIRLETKFAQSLKQKDQTIIKFTKIYHFSNTIFEHSIYQNPNQDFAKTFAQIQDNLIGETTKNKTNQLYLLDSFLIEYPCYSSIYSTIYANRYS